MPGNWWSKWTQARSSLRDFLDSKVINWQKAMLHMGVSENRGTPKINHPFWGTTIFGNTHIGMLFLYRSSPRLLKSQVAACADGFSPACTLCWLCMKLKQSVTIRGDGSLCFRRNTMLLSFHIFMVSVSSLPRSEFELETQLGNLSLFC